MTDSSLNLKAGAFAFLFLGLTVAGLLALSMAPPVVAFPMVLVGFSVFATICMTNAKTTGGFQNV